MSVTSDADKNLRPKMSVSSFWFAAVITSYDAYDLLHTFQSGGPPAPFFEPTLLLTIEHTDGRRM